MPLVLPLLCLFLERLVVVRVDDRGISDGIGSDGDGECCIGNVGYHCLSYIRDEASEDIGSDVRSRCIFFSVTLISSLPCCHCLIGLNTIGSDKIG